MKYRVVVTPTAHAEAMAAFHWYAEQSITVAERWYAELTQAIDRLTEYPSRCAISHDDSDALGYEVRQLLYGRRRSIFRILYTIDDDTVWILRIRHSAQAPIEH